MKKTILAIAATVLSVGAFANNPVKDQPFKEILNKPVTLQPMVRGGDAQNVVKFNPLAILFGRYSFAYERVLNESSSAELELALVSWTFKVVDLEYKLTGFRIAPQYRYYITHNSNPAPKGFFVAPFLEFASTKLSVTSKDLDIFSGNTYEYEGSASITMFGGGANIGYQWLIADAFAIDLYAGAGFLVAGDVKLKYTSTDPTAPVKAEAELPSSAAAGFSPNFGFALGWGF